MWVGVCVEHWGAWLCVGVGSMRIVAQECNFVLYVGVSMCKFVLRECVTCVSVFFSGVTMLPGSLRPSFWCASSGCLERLPGAREELWAGFFRLVASRSCGGVGCVMGVLTRSQGNGFGRCCGGVKMGACPKCWVVALAASGSLGCLPGLIEDM